MIKKDIVAVALGVTLCVSLFGIAVYHTYFYSIDGVWVIEPFLVDKTPVNSIDVLRVFPRDSGSRFYLYGNYTDIPADSNWIAYNQERLVIEGTQTFRYSDRSLHVWIDVDKMYPYALCLSENGTLKDLPLPASSG